MIVEDIQWNNNYSIGIRAIDTQHKALFETVNRLYILKDNEINLKEKLKAILYDFREYTQIHFKDEEAFMHSIGYNGLDEHKKLHQKIIDSINDILKNSSSLSIVKSKMRVLSKRLLLKHIVKEDIKIKYFIDEYNINEEIYEIK